MVLAVLPALPRTVSVAMFETNDTLAALQATGQPLGLKCAHCLHKALIEHRELKEKYPPTQSIAELPFRCEKCGRRKVHREFFRRRADATRFMRSDW